MTLSHEAVSIDSLASKFNFTEEFEGAALKDIWSTAGVGTATLEDQETGGLVRLTTGGANGNSMNLTWGGIRILLATKRLAAEFRFKLSSAAFVKAQMILFFDATHYIAFQFDTDLAQTEWEIECNDGAVTDEDSGITVDTDFHIFRIDCHTHDGNHVHFKIDGVETANSPIETNVPTEHLEPFILVKAREADVKNADISYIGFRQER